MALGSVGLRHPAVDSPSGCLQECVRPSVFVLSVSLSWCVWTLWCGVFGILCRLASWFLDSSQFDGFPACAVARGSHRPRVRLGWSRWAFWICLCAPLRFGEASHPGPDWTFGIANLNGLNSKAFGLVDSKVDSGIFSETHLTGPGEKAFRANLREAKAPYTSFVGGSPVPPRSEVSDIGQFSGVGVLSKYPVRRLSHAWPDVVFRSGRLVGVSVCCQGIWVSGIVVYGTPNGATHCNGREITNQLLSLATERLNHLNGPRFVAGDFNHDLERLPSATVLQRLGFQDCQDVHASRTCRNLATANMPREDKAGFHAHVPGTDRLVCVLCC